MRAWARTAVVLSVTVIAVMWNGAASATTRTTDVKVTVDRATAAVGATVIIPEHNYDLGPDSTDTSDVEVETIAPVGAWLVGSPGYPDTDTSACTWIKPKTDIRCYVTGQWWVVTGAPTDFRGAVELKIVSRITAPGHVILTCRPGRCVDPNTGNNRAAIIVNGVTAPSPSPKPTTKHTATPTHTPTVASSTSTPTTSSPAVPQQIGSASAIFAPSRPPSADAQQLHDAASRSVSPGGLWIAIAGLVVVALGTAGVIGVRRRRQR